MKCKIINSKNLFKFDIWNAKFYCNTNKKDREDVLKIKTNREVNIEIRKLKPILKNIYGYDWIVKKAKVDLGLVTIFGNVSSSLPFRPRTNLLILKRCIGELNKYHIERETLLKNELEHIQRDKKILMRLQK